MDDGPAPTRSAVTSSAAHPAGWDLPDLAERERARTLAEALGLPDAAGQVLVRRGAQTAEEATTWLELGEGDLHDPCLLPDLDAAATRLIEAIERGERIVVHGDYDADGICGTALLTRGLRRLGATVEPFVPDRARDGYGVATRLVEHAGQRDVGLLVTVDTGSSAHEALERARELGLQTIVCDHHLFDRRPAGATWFVNPHRPDSNYPHDQLCGSGIAHKLLTRVAQRRGGDAREELALAAIATVADQVELVRENRALVRLGLEECARTEIPGLRALLGISRLSRGRITEEDVAFQLAPRINAAGRIEKARTAVELFLAADPGQARVMAARLDRLNEERKGLDRSCAEDAVEMATEMVERDDPAGLVLASRSWHRGVVGIAAAKVAQRFDRPALLFAIEGDVAVGSARSAHGLDLKQALDGCAHLLDQHGGHAAAAGATVQAGRIGSLQSSFAASVAALVPQDTSTAIRIDAVLAAEDIGDAMADFLARFGPYGTGHRSPRFAVLGMAQTRPARVVGQGHLRLQMDFGGTDRGMIGFSKADQWLGDALAHERLNVAFSLRHRPESAYEDWDLVLNALTAGPAAPAEPPAEMETRT